ncbi:MAG TPA: MOSC N-terminal beta barrel domain-containing protein [Blastocatellia bacterium]|nr:MOSC N-terminal beta barrel domain-containing protein [Blastocatellia bacterium]
MIKELGRVKALFRYPVRSMAGEQLESVRVGPHGFETDRRLALFYVGGGETLRRLKAEQLPQLVRYKPLSKDGGGPDDLPTHTITPDGRELALQGEQLRGELSAAYGSRLQMMRVEGAEIPEAGISLIGVPTIKLFERSIGKSLSPRQFRPNMLIETRGGNAFEEEGWLGRVIKLGAGAEAPSIRITMRNRRCRIVNIDLETGAEDTRVLKTVMLMNNKYAGIYASVVRTGTVTVGDALLVEQA